MTTNYHTAITVGASANAATINTPLAALDAELTTLDGRVDLVETNLRTSGASVSRTTEAANAAQKVVKVESSALFGAGAYVEYLLAGGTLERNTIGTINSATQITLGANIGTGGIADDTLVSVVPMGFYNATVGTFNARDFGASPDASGASNVAAIQMAIDAAEAAHGGIVTLPAGDYDIDATITIINTASIYLLGSGGEIKISGGTYQQRGTRLVWTGSTNDIMLALLNAQGTRIEGIGFYGGGVSGITGIQLDSDNNPDSYQNTMAHCTFRDLAVCIDMATTDPYSTCDAAINRCTFLDDYIEGVRISSANAYDIWISECTFLGTLATTNYDINCVKGKIQINSCAFGKTKGTGSGAQIYVGTGRANIIGCYSEGEYIPFFMWDTVADAAAMSNIIGCDLRLSNLVDECALHINAASTVCVVGSFIGGKVQLDSSSGFVNLTASYITGTLGGNDANIVYNGYRAGAPYRNVVGSSGAGQATIAGTAPELLFYDTDAASMAAISNSAGVLDFYRPGVGYGPKMDLVNGRLDLHSAAIKLCMDSAAATTLGTVTGKLTIYNNGGAVIGYLPLYNAIT